MCGFSFGYSLSMHEVEMRTNMAHSLNLLKERGPDQAGCVLRDGAIFGHRRLSIIDIHSSLQPLTDETGRYTLVFNGEIYNYRELRGGLKDTWTFKTDGDTEVLLAGLVLEGVSFLKKMEGMWAFCLWDSKLRKLLMSRDRFGKKPLFFSTNGKELWASSELPALKALIPYSLSENPKSLVSYLEYGFCPAGSTFYSEIGEVKPSHYMWWSEGAGISSMAYWNPFDHKMGGASYDLKDLLESSVSKRLVADVEVGAFLSGGVDSSIISSIAARHQKIKTFSIGFRDPSYDESKYAQSVSAWIGSEHHAEYYEESAIGDVGDLTLRRLGQPFADVSLVPSMQLCRLASRYVKVALSGDGADELFSGYQRYQGAALLQIYFKAPVIVRKVIEKLVRSLPETYVHHSASLLKKAQLFIAQSESYEKGGYVAPRNWRRSEVYELFGLAGETHLEGAEFDLIKSPDDILEMMHRDAFNYMVQNILRKVDAASMDSSLEVRCPFLDSKVAEAALQAPLHMHRGLFAGKKWLKSSCYSLIPKFVWKRRKHGFSVPVGEWLLSSQAREVLLFSGHDLNQKSIDRLLAEHSNGKDHSQRLWALYMYLLWRLKG
ncbi:asparagine synthase (glutamine-hydrolyzing) [Hahella sp. CR1]|uniref:asparagine synthase (glutamine-hydrolyzing) n=1 Tax=Hahella sp. CR1 TaxID=2992807 RepID=UPI0024410FFC|nr:asparagine synthase (glutamine-hydrolyzing) [Hahella sp. CR1]MDG9668256.1 asparagine synthase (glutamine-hydrolyzing) [Hahella sp. CR1]